MASVVESQKLVEGIVRLRRAARVAEVAPDVAPVRRELESRLGPTLSRSRAGQILGVSQTALDRWVATGQVPVVYTPRGRREVPSQFVVELREAIDELLSDGTRRHALAAALADRRKAAEEIEAVAPFLGRRRPEPPRGHETAERRSHACHSLVAERLDERMLEDAQANLERLTAAGHIHESYAERWRALLARPVAEVARAISADSRDASDLRQSSPFAGVLNEQERRRIIEMTR